MKKHSLAILMAMGAPKSTNENGMVGDSMTEPDQGGPEGDEMPEEEEPEEEGEDMLDMPKGFKPPSSAADGGMFTTTIRAQVVDGKLKVLVVGDMPLKEGESAMEGQEESAAPADEDPDQSQQPALSDEGAAIVKRRKDAMVAQKAFQK